MVQIRYAQLSASHWDSGNVNGSTGQNSVESNDIGRIDESGYI